MRQPSPGEIFDTVLVVEDEMLIQMCTADHLRDCGYQVFEASTVAEAIAILNAEDSIDIIFTDINMPGGRDGFDLTRWVAVNRPEVKVILTSGGVDAAGLAADLCHAGPMIAKPYRMPNVAARIHAALHSGPNLSAVA